MTAASAAAPASASAGVRQGAGGADRRLAAGCAAGMGLAAAGSWLRLALDGTLRVDSRSLSYALASAVAGAGLVLGGACALRLAPRAGRLGWRALWGFALAGHGLAFLAVPLTSSDAFTALAFGALAAAGLSPYAHAPAELAGSPLLALVPPRWAGDPSPYGPLFHPVARAAAWAGARLPAPPWGALYAYKALLLAALLAALALAARHLRRARPGEAAETFAALALAPLLAWEISAQAHNDALLVLALTAFAAAAAAGRDLVAAAALAAGVAVKYALAPLLALYLVLVGRRSLARAALLALAALAVLAAAFWPEARAVTLRAVLPMVGGEAGRHAHSLADLACLVLDGLGWPAASRATYRALSAASAVLCAGMLARAALRSRTLEELAHGWLLFLLALFLTTPWFQPWYVAWGLPLLLLEPDARWRRFFARYAVVTVCLWAAPLDPVTNVLADGWAAWRIWRLTRPAPSPALERP